MRSLRSVSVAVVLSLTTCTVAWAAEESTQGFDFGWIPSAIGGDVSLQYTGGSPDYYLKAAGSSTIGAVTLQDQFTGDYLAAGIRTILFNLNLVSGSVPSPRLRLRYQSGFFNGWYYPLTLGPIGQWTSHIVDVDPTWSDSAAVAAGWMQEPDSASFTELMQDVYTFELRGVAVGQSELGIDNVALSTTPTAAPEVNGAASWGRIKDAHR